VCAAFDGRRTLFIAAGVSVPVAMDPETGRLLASPSDCRTDALTVAGETAGVLEVTGQTTRVRLYRAPAVRFP
jgi:hypothetical protein